MANKYGNNLDNILHGDGTDQSIYGYGGDDELFGAAGNDDLYGSSGADELNGGEGDDYMSGGSGDDVIEDTSGFDRILGGAGNDTIVVDGGRGELFFYDEVQGGTGNDTIAIGDSKVIAFGGADNDTFFITPDLNQIVSGGAGNDIFTLLDRMIPVDSPLFPWERNDLAAIHGDDVGLVDTDGSLKNGFGSVQYGVNDGVDTLDLSRLSLVEANLTGLSAQILTGLTVDLEEYFIAANTIYAPTGETFSHDIATVFNIENVIGSQGDDTVIGNAEDNLLLGNGGIDVMAGGSGDDRLEGGADLDILFGDGGEDRLEGGSGTDELHGGDQDDILYGGLDGDELNGDAHNDLLFGQQGNDELNGGSGNDELNGGADDDTLNGGSGLDFLRGGSGVDVLSGGGNADTLVGGSGADFLTGGLASDIFRFEATETVLQTFTDQFGNFVQFPVDVFDRINDFTLSGSAQDRIDVGYLLDQETTFAGTTAQQAIDQGYIYFVANAAGTGMLVMIDLNGTVNGGSHHGLNDIAIADVIGVGANQLNASHFIV